MLYMYIILPNAPILMSLYIISITNNAYLRYICYNSSYSLQAYRRGFCCIRLSVPTIHNDGDDQHNLRITDNSK